MKQAFLFKPYDRGDEVGGTQTNLKRKVRCILCAHRCIIDEDQFGICKVRKNSEGRLDSLNYDRIASASNDPIEKKPLYHFLPGSTTFSFAAMGCNFKCQFCQNHSLSMVQGERHIYGEPVPPERLVDKALQYGSRSISYTYSEPTVFFEIMIETAKIAREKGLKNVMVTNGYMTPEALDEISPYLDAANIDLKAFTEDFYKKYCGARLAPVLNTIRGMKAKGIWVELTTLMIPGLNDNPEEIKQLISFILEVDPSMPWHVSRFYPQYRMTDIPPTNPRSIYNVLEMASKMGVKYLYAGNVGSENWSDTRCPSCENTLIERDGYDIRVMQLANGCCRSCGQPIAGVWSTTR